MVELSSISLSLIGIIIILLFVYFVWWLISSGSGDDTINETIEPEELTCEICGEIIPEGDARYTFPDLAHYIDPGVKHMQIWCEKCVRSFYDNFKAWRYGRMSKRI